MILLTKCEPAFRLAFTGQPALSSLSAVFRRLAQSTLLWRHVLSFFSPIGWHLVFKDIADSNNCALHFFHVRSLRYIFHLNNNALRLLRILQGLVHQFSVQLGEFSALSLNFVHPSVENFCSLASRRGRSIVFIDVPDYYQCNNFDYRNFQYMIYSCSICLNPVRSCNDFPFLIFFFGVAWKQEAYSGKANGMGIAGNQEIYSYLSWKFVHESNPK